MVSENQLYNLRTSQGAKLLCSWNTSASWLVRIAQRIHQLQTLIYYEPDQSRYHGRAAAVKNQRTAVCNTMAVHKLRATATCRGGSRPAGQWRCWAAVRDGTRLVSRECLSKALFAHGRMSEHPQTTLYLCLILGLVICFPFVVANLECDISVFLYASLAKLKMFKMYYRGDIVVESPTKPCCTLCTSSFLCN